jgi:2Fe-2S ferredoxin
MPRITYILTGGEERRLDVPAGTTLMRAAVDNDIPGIDGDCGGKCACATCHVYVEQEWLPRLPAATAHEEEILTLAQEVRANSRLGCQIALDESLDGLTVRMPSRVVALSSH